MSKKETVLLRKMLQVVADLERYGVLDHLSRSSRHRLRTDHAIVLSQLQSALEAADRYLSPTPSACVSKLNGLRASSRASGLSVNTVAELLAGRGTLRSYVQLAHASRRPIRVVKLNRRRAALWTANDDEWITPPELLDLLYPLISGELFDLDPCSPCHGPDAPVRARKHFTKIENGLIQPWDGVTFVNPPFNRLVNWLEKAISEVACGHAVVIFLCPARIDSKWWYQYVVDQIPMIGLRGRLEFRGGATAETTRNAPFASTLLILGAEKTFIEAIQDATKGWLVWPYRAEKADRRHSEMQNDHVGGDVG